jgi:GrpB-like predicted nucleotidyltransferase (UPF0157 family)/AraC-like DNA-binding protein
MESMTNQLGFGVKRFSRRLSAQVGIALKLYARIMRCRNSLVRTREIADPDWVEVAVRAGYYDQAHCIHDFHEFAASTPSAYWVRRRPIRIMYAPPTERSPEYYHTRESLASKNLSFGEGVSISWRIHWQTKRAAIDGAGSRTAKGIVLTVHRLLRADALIDRMSIQPPIILEPYDRHWPARFEIERQVLESALQPWLAGPIEHVGSTAVPGLTAKPIIDIMAAVSDLASSKPAIEAVAPLGYCYAPYKADVMHWFCKPNPFVRSHHLHMVPFGSRLWQERIAFREALRTDADVRRQYMELKAALAAKYRDDREGYTEGKTEFIKSVLTGARS